MPLTPETLLRHELAGLRVEVVEAANPDLVGVGGRVVRETTKTLVIGDEAGARERQVPKEGTTFEFALPAADGEEAAGAEGADVVSVTVEGARLVARPARRTETGGDPTWR